MQVGDDLVKSAVSKLETLEKPLPDVPEVAESPRAAGKVEGRRSRIAKRALAVFRMSRSVSADRTTECSPALALAGDIVAWPDLEAGKLQASVERREEMGECQRFVNGVPLLNRRLSMGDSRVDESGSFERKMSWDDLVRPERPFGVYRAQGNEMVVLPVQLHQEPTVL